MTLKRLDAAPTLRRRRSGDTAGGAELPHFNSLVQTAADKVAAIGREGNAVDTVLVAIRALEALCKVASHVPDPDTLVQGSGSNELLVGRDSNSRDTIFNREDRRVLPGFNVPETDGSVAAARSNRPAIARKIETIDILFMAVECVANGPRLDIPDLNQER